MKTPSKGDFITNYCTPAGFIVEVQSDGYGGTQQKRRAFTAQCGASKTILELQELFANAKLDGFEWMRDDNKSIISEDPFFRALAAWPEWAIVDMCDGFFPNGMGFMTTDIRDPLNPVRYTYPSQSELLWKLTTSDTTDNKYRKLAYGLITSISAMVKEYNKDSEARNPKT